MNRTLIPTVAASLVLFASPALAKDPVWPADQVGQETSIPFMDTIGLYNFEAEDDKGVYLQDQQRHWYYAVINGVCTGLPFANKIAVDTRFGGTQLDRTGTLLVDGQRCPINSLTKSNGPPPKAKKAKKG